MAMKSIEEYYLEKFGKPARQAEYLSPEGHKIEIYKWDEQQTNKGVAMYATIGASDVLGGSSSGCEFFIGLTPEVDDIAQTLADISLHGRGNQSIPDSGDSITLSYPLWRGTKAKTFLFTSGDEIIPPVQIDEKEVVFRQLVPLFETELDYKKENGEQELWSAFESKQVPYWDSGRSQAL